MNAFNSATLNERVIPMEIIRVGVVGVGNIGSAHAQSIANNKISGMVLSAICDVNPQKLDWAKEQFPDCALFSDYNDLLKSGTIDAIIIAVPHRLHAQIAEAFLLSDIHVLVEKPVDISVSIARKLNETAKSVDRVFAIMFNQRTNLLFKKAKELVKSGALGELKRSIWIITNWYRTQSYYDSGSWRATWSGEGGGVLLNQAPHNLDLWQWICGMPKSVTAVCSIGKYHNIEVEDNASIFAEFENGAEGTFITSTGESPGTNRLEISGSLGKIVIENGLLKWWRLKESERTFCFNADQCFTEIEYEYEEFKDTGLGGGHIDILQNFADAIIKKTPLVAPGIEGINELTISNAAYLSSWSGNKKIMIPFDEAKFDELLAEKIKNSSYVEKNQNGLKPKGYNPRWNVKW